MELLPAYSLGANRVEHDKESDYQLMFEVVENYKGMMTLMLPEP